MSHDDCVKHSHTATSAAETLPLDKELVETTFRDWLSTRHMSEELVGSLREIPVEAQDAKALARVNSVKALFVGLAAAQAGRWDTAASLLVAAFHVNASLCDTQWFEDLEPYAEELGIDLHISAARGDESAIDAFCRTVMRQQADYDRVCEHVRTAGARSWKRVRQAPAYLCTVEELAYEICSRVMHPVQPFGDEHYIHMALFWVNAYWAHRTGAPVVASEPVRQTLTPVYRDVHYLIKDWKDGTLTVPDHRVEDEHLLRAIEATVSHVTSMSSRAACDEIHEEPIWSFTPQDTVMSNERLVRAYAHDPNGNLRRIFGALLHASTTFFRAMPSLEDSARDEGAGMSRACPDGADTTSAPASTGAASSADAASASNGAVSSIGTWLQAMGST